MAYRLFGRDTEQLPNKKSSTSLPYAEQVGQTEVVGPSGY